METKAKVLRTLRKSLAPVAQECAIYESEQILQYLLNCSRSDLYFKNFPLIDDTVERRIRTIVTRRISGEPLAYILGSVFFYSMEISVNRHVLIPRPETEVLVETILKTEPQSAESFVDFGTGSGAILAVLCKERPLWHGLGMDKSFDAIKTATLNCKSNYVTFLCSDNFSSINQSVQQKYGFDFIVSNPPYISGDEMKSLDASVTTFEPHSALYGGNDGMDFYRLLAKEGKNILKSGGRLYCEMGSDQGETIRNIFQNACWNNINIIFDLAGRQRVISACHNGLLYK